MSEKVCRESCFLYDVHGKGCSYLSGDFSAKEKVEPGYACLHPDFSNEQLRDTTLWELCQKLTSKKKE